MCIATEHDLWTRENKKTKSDNSHLVNSKGHEEI